MSIVFFHLFSNPSSHQPLPIINSTPPSFYYGFIMLAGRYMFASSNNKKG